MSETREIVLDKKKVGPKTVSQVLVLRSITTRKIQRAALKDYLGNNHIRKDWRTHQSNGKDATLNKLYAIANSSAGGKRQRALDRISQIMGR